MAITAADVSKLRSATGAGMMDCKKALDEANGDMDLAAEILRKKGILKAAKRADKIAADGSTVVKATGDTAAIAEINAETDFVAKNDNFVKLVGDIADHLIATKPSTLESAYQTTMNGKTVEEYLTGMAANIGEKISLRRFNVVTKNSTQSFGAYVHMGGKMSVLVVLDGTTDENLAKEIAMHVAAANPKCIRRDEVDPTLATKEQEIFSAQLKTQGKPENIIVNILKGKMEKFYGEICLLEQPFIKNEDQTVQKYLDSKGTGITVSKMIRYELGEGIEKNKTDFAAEVAEQLK
ncbi:MAG: translation elongation factor Ts [bacterium]|nr:translation elongation factor Ts [bacterium]